MKNFIFSLVMLLCTMVVSAKSNVELGEHNNPPPISVVEDVTTTELDNVFNFTQETVVTYQEVSDEISEPSVGTSNYTLLSDNKISSTSTTFYFDPGMLLFSYFKPCNCNFIIKEDSNLKKPLG